MVIPRQNSGIGNAMQSQNWRMILGFVTTFLTGLAAILSAFLSLSAQAVSLNVPHPGISLSLLLKNLSA